MKICILGAGALGCAIGGVLTEAGHEVWLVNRHAEQVEIMTLRGLTLRSEGVDRVVPVRAVTRAQDVDGGVVDLVVVLVKSFHTAEAMSSALTLIGPNTAVLSLQNGLGHEDILADIVGRGRVLAGKTYVGGTQLAPGHVIASTVGKLSVIGELDGGVSTRVQGIADVFTAAGLQTCVSDCISGIIWDKLLINVATGALSGVTGLPYGLLYQVPEIEACAVAAVAEAMAVARASGIRLSITEPMDAWQLAGAGLPPEFRTSMLQSLDKGSVTEIDYINGAVVRQGAKVGVPTPVNLALVACIKGMERRLNLPS
ncbi:MAG: ketopantoate reductase family protein [Pseudomonadota bacterium]